VILSCPINFIEAIGRNVQRHPFRSCFYLSIFFLAGLFYFTFLKDLPNPYLLAFKQPNASTRIYDRNGKLLYKIYNQENRTLLPLEEIPNHVKQATIAIEDQNFYGHRGFSLRGIARAIRHDFLLREEKNTLSLQGGSTITQQLVKNALLTPERTIERKFKEIFLASAVEFIFEKDEILNMYLNQVAYGGTAYGVEEAAQTYFGKSARHLNLAEAALLAGLPASPTTYSPFGANPQLAKKRQVQVLNRMVADNYITQEEAETAKKEILAFAPQAIPIKAPHFVLYVKDELSRRYGQQVVEKGGLQVYTTLDLDVQELAEKAVQKNIEEVEERFNLHNGSALVTKPKTGEILAMVGSVNFWDFKNDGNVNLTTSLRQPGSSIKMVNYAYALEHTDYTPSSILLDTPVSYSNPWETYTPVNYDGKFKGRVTLKTAFAESRNVPAVKVLNSYGVDKMIEQGKKMGITTWTEPEKYGLSLTLGAAEVKMTDMAVVFGSVANMGVKKDLTSVKKIVDSQGKVIQDIEKPRSLWAAMAQKAYASDSDSIEGGEPVVSPFTAWQLIDILSDNAARAPEFGINSPLRIQHNNQDQMIFVKTGTSNDFRDNWTDGCSTEYCVLTWVGNNDNAPMRKIASGITGAAPMWHEIMEEINKNNPGQTFPVPQGMIEVEVCAVNGLLPCKGCPQTKKAYFIPGTEPKQKCYFPSPAECQAKKKKMEEEGKPAEEIVKALQGCPLTAPSSPPSEPKPNP
jgi:penicillin-binding protein 1C